VSSKHRQWKERRGWCGSWLFRERIKVQNRRGVEGVPTSPETQSEKRGKEDNPSTENEAVQPKQEKGKKRGRCLSHILRERVPSRRESDALRGRRSIRSSRRRKVEVKRRKGTHLRVSKGEIRRKEKEEKTKPEDILTLSSIPRGGGRTAPSP